MKLKEFNKFVFDVEVYKYDFHVNFKTVGKKEFFRFHNDNEGIKKFIVEKIGNSIFFGFNNHYYDNWILSAILDGKKPEQIFKLSQRIIVDQVKPWSIGLKNLKILSMDLMSENINNMYLSLKEAEANMGLKIVEGSVDFKIDRKLTKEELKESFDYCDYDLIATEKLLNYRIDWINAKFTLVEMNDWDPHFIKKTNAQLTAKALGVDFDDPEFDKNLTIEKYEKPLDLNLGRYDFLMSKYLSPLKVEELVFETEIGKLVTQFGTGGLHSAIPNYTWAQNSKYKMFNIDVVSYYPFIIINKNLLSRNVKDVNRYVDIVNKRVFYKNNGRKNEALALKKCIVTAYGAMNNQWNPLYDPEKAIGVSITGQLYLVDLIDKLENFGELIQANTDGIIFKIKTENEKILLEKLNEWEKRTSFKLEVEEIKLLIQKDVNNYFIKKTNNKIKVKGGYLKAAHDDWDQFSKNNLRILDLALYEYFKNGTSPRSFIITHTEPLDFQLVAKSSKLFDGLIYQNKNIGRIARVFATNKKLGGIYKDKKGSHHKIPDSPKNCYIFNGDIKDFNWIDADIDYDFYIEKVEKRIKDFLKIDRVVF